MERTNYQASNCSIARTLQVFGEKWTLLIIRESFYGATRFEQFHRVLQCPRNLLSERLTMLVDEGILERSEYREPGSRARNEYRMTDMGRELMPILLALCSGATATRPTPTARPCSRAMPAAARTCGHAHLRRRARGRPSPDEIELVDGPGALPPVPA